MYCTQKLYNKNIIKNITLQLKNHQYVYYTINSNSKYLNTTHNHTLLTEKIWKRQDQIKKHHFDNFLLLHTFQLYPIITLYPFTLVKLLDREKVYDIQINEYYNFILKKRIIHNSIEQDADLVLMLYKDNNHEHNLSEQVLDIVIAKHRNGPIGNFQLLFYADTCKFSNIKKSHYLNLNNTIAV